MGRDIVGSIVISELEVRVLLSYTGDRRCKQCQGAVVSPYLYSSQFHEEIAEV